MERAVGVNVDKEISLYLLPGEVKEENEDGADDSEVKNPFYGCPECQKMFKNIGEVEKHIRTNHDSDVTENVVRLV